MDRHPRKSAELDLPDPLRTLLCSLRERWQVTGKGELDVDRVRDVEAVVGCHLPDPLLALFAAELPFLRDSLRMELSHVVGHTKAAHRSRVQRDFVAIGAEQGRWFYGFLNGRGPERLYVYDDHARSLSPHDVTTWLTERADREGSPEHKPTPTDGTFVPWLIRHVEVAGAEAGAKRVRHRSWGEGKVLAEIGEGPLRKVKAEFPGLGLKTVQARFLDFIDE